LLGLPGADIARIGAGFIVARIRPVAARCEWCNLPGGWLANAAGLPAAPFRTDSWDNDVP
jgi:hypothetical protein